METPENPSPENCERNPQTSKKSKRSKLNARRFSDHQIKSLESIFELETKLDPKKKSEVAKDLELHPRQVAIWFQNRRARWKSKQIEQEYRKLKTSYDNLYIQFDELKKERHSLQMQLQELSDLMENHAKIDHDMKGKSRNSATNHERILGVNDFKDVDQDNERRFTKYEDKTQLEGDEDDDELEAVRSWPDEEGENFSHLASPDTWRNLSAGGLFHQPFGSSNWWEDQ